MNKWTRWTKLFVCFMTAMMLAVFVTTLPVFAIEGNADGGGETGSISSGGWGGDHHSGYRISVIKADGTLIAAKDLRFSQPENIAASMQTLKLGNGQSAEFDIIPPEWIALGIPKPILYDAGINSLVGNGDKLKQWLIGDGGADSTGYMEDFINRAFPGSLTYNDVLANEYRVCVEPLLWTSLVNSSGVVYPGGKFYGTVSNFAELGLTLQSWIGNAYQGNMQRLLSEAAPWSMFLLESDSFRAIGKTIDPPSALTGTKLAYEDILGSGGALKGFGIHIYTPSNTGTHTFDSASFPSGDPGPAPLPVPSEEGENEYTIIKFYAEILTHEDGSIEEVPLSNFTRSGNPASIRIQDEPLYRLADYYTSPTLQNPTPSSIYDEFKVSMPNIRSGTTPTTITLADPETTLYMKLVKSGQTLTASGEGSLVLEQSQITKAISTADGRIPGWGLLPATFHADDMSGSHAHYCSGCAYDEEDDLYCPGHYCTAEFGDSDYHYSHQNAAPILQDIQAEHAAGIFAAKLSGDQSGNWGITGGSKTFSSFVYESVLWRGQDVPTIAKYKEPSTHPLLALTKQYSNVSQQKRKLNTSSYSMDISIEFDLDNGKSDNNTYSEHSYNGATWTKSTHSYDFPTYTADVLVKVYAGNPSNKSKGMATSANTLNTVMNMNGYTSNASGKMKQYADSMKFFPYLRMTWQQTAQYDPSRTEVHVLSEYISEILPNAYAEAGWQAESGSGSGDLSIKSQQWSGWTRLTDGSESWKKPNQVLPGGAIYTLDTASTNLRVKIATWQPVITDDRLREAMQDAGTNVEAFTPEEARAAFGEYEQTAANTLEHLRVVQWVNTDTDATHAWSSGGVKFDRPGMVVDGRTTNTDSKYSLFADTTASGRDNKANQGDLDIRKSITEERFYKVYADVYGNILVAQATSISGINSAVGTVVASRTVAADNIIDQLNGIYLELDDKTRIITNFAKALERNQGADTSESILASLGGKWYNEAWDGIVIQYNASTFDVGFLSTKVRSAALDPALCPPNRGGQSTMGTKAVLSQFRCNDMAEGQESMGSEYLGTFKGVPITLKNMADMLHTMKFYIPNMNVQDLH